VEREDYVGADGKWYLGVCQLHRGATNRSKRPRCPYFEGRESQEDNPRRSEGSLDPSFIGKEISQCHVGGSKELISEQERESHNGVEGEAQGQEDDRIMETVTSYLTRIQQVQDELATVGETVSDSELVRTTLKGFTKEWTSFIKGVVA
jgi:hypothetical protein